jgi:HKD family nuclease
MRFFADGRAVVIGAPQTFDLLLAIKSSSSIRLATAFAHKTGWDILAPAISESKAEKFLLAGASFFQTEPKVLRKWLEMSKSGTAKAALHTEKGITFHPKVLLVEGKKTFAIVGSGNLSRGGLIDNVECGVFVDSGAQLSELRAWFDKLFGLIPPLDDAIVFDYERKWASLQKARRALLKQQQELQDELATKNVAVMNRRKDAIAAAKKFLISPRFKQAYKHRVAGGARIKEVLRYPAFDFDKEGWKDFYTVQELGHLIAIDRDRVFRKKTLLQEGFRQLIGEDSAVPRLLDELLASGGRFRIKGLGVNVVSKILAVHAPKKWTVFNTVVDRTMRSFGYVSPRGASRAEKFIAFTRMMEEFKLATGLKDAYALDAFFYDFYDHNLKLKK